MKRTTLAVVVALFAIWSSGCGTIANLTSGNPEVPFGGVQRDIALVETPRETPSGIGLVPSMLVFVLPIEMSLSFVGDLVTLPLAIGMHHSDPYVPVDGHNDPAPAVTSVPTPESPDSHN
jgi:uncharacterized protein YceK